MSKGQAESEVVVYCLIGDMSGFAAADITEGQIQLESEYKNGVRCRVRKTMVSGEEAKYVFTTKKKVEDDSGMQSMIEKNVIVNEEFYQLFKETAIKGLVKTRYIFKSKSVTLNVADEEGNKTEVALPEITYDVDVYTKADGTKSNWCKIDVEMDQVVEYINANHPELKDKHIKLGVKVSHLPFKPTECMLSTDETFKDKLGSIWDNEWNRNPLEVDN